MARVEVEVNGTRHELEGVEPRLLLVHFLRERNEVLEFSSLI